MEGLGAEVEDKIDQEAWLRSDGDATLYLHHRALLVREDEIHRRGQRE